MDNTKRKLWKTFLVIGILSSILLSGCGKEKNAEAEKPTENTSPSEKVTEQAVSEWKEMYASFYEYQDCSAVLVERTENDGTVDEIFTLDITYMSGQPGSDEPEHSHPVSVPEASSKSLRSNPGTVLY